MRKLLIISAMALTGLGLYAKDLPEYPGGEGAMKQFISENAKYPATAMDNGVEGIVVVDFIVATDGSLKDFKVEKFVDPDLEAEAIRVVKKMPPWVPADQNGTPIEAPAKAEVPFILP